MNLSCWETQGSRRVRQVATGYLQSGSRGRLKQVSSFFSLVPQPMGQCLPYGGWVFLPQWSLQQQRHPKVCLPGDSNSTHSTQVDSEEQLWQDWLSKTEVKCHQKSLNLE